MVVQGRWRRMGGIGMSGMMLNVMARRGGTGREAHIRAERGRERMGMAVCMREAEAGRGGEVR